MKKLMDLSAKRPAKRSSGVVMMFVIVGVFACVGLFLWRLDLDPNISIPAPSIPPSPNAMDDYAKAQSLLTDKNLFEGTHPRGTSTASALSPSVQDRVLRDNAPALSALRAGLTHEYAAPSNRVFGASYTFSAHDREIARFLAFQRDVHAARGEWGAAMKTTLDGLQMGADMRRNDGLRGMLVGIAVGSISRDPKHQIVDQLNPEETNAALARIRKINAGSVPLARTLQQTEWNEQARLMTLFRQPNWRNQLTAGMSGPGSGAPPYQTRLIYALTSKRRVMSDYTQCMDGMVEDARARHPLKPVVPSASDPIRDLLVVDVSYFQPQYNDDLTQNQFLELQLALRAYKFAYGSYPETLQALTPVFSTSLPDDQFAHGKPLHYRKQGDNYLLYSIGPDGVDDGGKAIFDPKRGMGRYRYFVFDESKGDVVAGVNF